MNGDSSLIFDKFPNRKREDLIPLLQSIQDVQGSLSEEIIAKVATYLNISPNKIYGVATFYDNFRFIPKGKYHFRLCQGTACHIGGGALLLKDLERQLKIGDGETDKKGLFSLEVVSCLGACGLGPLVEINGNYHTKMTLDSLKTLINSLREQEQTGI